MPTRIYLCRHAEPDETARGRFCSRDAGLSETGRARASALGATLAEARLAALYSSPLRRARETAELIAAKVRLEVVEAEDLAEVDFGELEGLTYEEAEVRFPAFYGVWSASPVDASFPRGECHADVRARAVREVARICEAHEHEAVAIVTHAGPIRALLGDTRLTLDYGSATLVEWPTIETSADR